jgi:hypothetical protein
MYHRLDQYERYTTEEIADILQILKPVDIAPGPGGSRISAVITQTIPLFRAGTARLVALYPSSQIVAHCDPPIPGLRYHLPLQVNDGCWVFSDGTWQQLEVGVVYQMDPSLRHGAVNWGHEVRIHLMLDVTYR